MSSFTSRLKKVMTREEESPPEGAAAPPDLAAVDGTALSRDAVVELLRDELVSISENKLARDEIDPSGHLFDFGYVDSLSAVIFLAHIEERFGVQIEDVELIETATDLVSIADRITQAG